jgi:lipopolysaccharide export system permease protein
MAAKIDRYILKQFILTFMFGVLAFVVIYIAIDLMERLDDFFDRNVPTPIILKYYLFYVPEMIHLIVPIGMLLASLFTIGKLDQTHELTAIRAAGRSMPRIVVPLLLFGVCVSSFMVYFDGWVLPLTNKKKYAIERQHLGINQIGGQSNVHLRLSPSMNLLMDYFDPATGQANRVSVERFDTAADLVVTKINRRSNASVEQLADTSQIIKITERVDAGTMHYDSVAKQWVLVSGIARNFNDPSRIATTQFSERRLPLPVTPAELNLSQQNTAELTLDELRDRIQQEEIGGRDVTKLLIDYHAKFAFPFAAFIVIFFGIPFSSNQRKGGAAVQIAITAMVSAVYLILTEISKTFTYGSDFPPALTAWMANIVFFAAGLFNLFRVERG